MADQIIKLILIDDPNWQSWKTDPMEFLARNATNGKQAREWLAAIMAQSHEYYARHGIQAPWIGYVAIDRGQDRVIGTCGFKGPPQNGGEVEISYGTMPPFEGRGFGTAMAAAMVELAFREASVKRVIAHTMPESNASGRILTKNGFRCEGEVMDPEDGKVWRWVKDQG